MSISKEETARRINEIENWPKLISFPEGETFNPNRGINCISLENLAAMMDTSIEHITAMLDKAGTNKDFPNIRVELEDSVTRKLNNVFTFSESRRVPEGLALCYTGRSEPINGISILADFEIEITGYARNESKPKQGA